MLRDYQAKGLEQISHAWRRKRSRSVLYVLPTGGGKTRIGVEACARTLKGGGQALWLVHGRQLVHQSAQVLRAESSQAVGVVMGDEKKSLGAPIQVASIDTLRERGWHLPWTPKLVIADEAHHFKAEGYEHVLSLFPDAYTLGLTATPYRKDGKALGDIFERLVVGPSVKDLTRQGFLVPVEVWSPPSPSSTLASHPVDAYLQRSFGRRAVVYTPSVREAKSLKEDFQAEGIASAVITGETKKAQRDAIFKGIASGQIRVVVNVGVLTEGVDCPPLEVCILARSVGSQTLYLQMCGRVLRPSPGTKKQDALVLDLAGSVLLHGLPDSEREYSLARIAGLPKATQGEQLAVCRTCGIARTLWPCPSCGYSPPIKHTRIKEKKLRRTTIYATEAHRKKSLETLIRKAINGKYKEGYVRHAYANLFGRELPKEEVTRVRARLKAGK